MEEEGVEDWDFGYHTEGVNLRKNVSLSDGLRSLFLRMVQGGRYPSVPDGLLRLGVGIRTEQAGSLRSLSLLSFKISRSQTRENTRRAP